MNVRELLERGQAAQDAAHQEQEEAKRGNLRGGSAGVVGTDGLLYGECPRVALVRMLGIDKQHEANRSIMFDAGNATEDSWATKLLAAGCEIRREDECPVSVEIAGKLVTGRPDIVIGRMDWPTPEECFIAGRRVGKSAPIPPLRFVPELGLELKGIYSAGSAVRVEVEGIPDAKHLAQAGFYSLALGIPYVICYTNPSVIDVPYWAIKRLSAPKKLQPFYRLFYMRWTDDEILEYRDEQSNDWVQTKYTKQGIRDFYALVAELAEKKALGPRPGHRYADGTPMPFNSCDYCPFRAECDNYDGHGSYDEWLDGIKLISEK